MITLLIRRLVSWWDRVERYGDRVTGLAGIGITEPGVRCGNCGWTAPLDGYPESIMRHVRDKHRFSMRTVTIRMFRRQEVTSEQMVPPVGN